MGIVGLTLVPGVNAEFTPSLNQSAIQSCNLIRFRAGLPEKLGGWAKYIPTSFSGTPRAMHAWQDLQEDKLLAVATAGSGTGLAVIANGTAISQVTPLAYLSNFTANFSTTGGNTTVEVNDPNIANVTIYDSVFFNTPVSVGGAILQGTYPITSVTGTTSYTLTLANAATSTATGTGTVPEFAFSSGSPIVTVTLPTNGLVAGNRFTFPIPTSTAGITIDGTYAVSAVPNADTFTISANTQATASTSAVMNGGLAQLLYSITLGPQAAGVGYGLGGYGEGGYGTGIVPNAQTGTAIVASDWSLDNWGEILLACPKDGGIYQWQPNTGFINAGLIATAPPFNSGIFVAMPAQILVAWGSTSVGIEQDPLTVRWSDQEDFTQWTPSNTNQAGSFHIPRGSKIVRGIQGPQQALIFTDVSLWAMVYQGQPYVFGFNEVMTGCGLIGPHAVTVMRGSVFWMSSGNFFVMSGQGPQDIPCSVWDVVFQDLDENNQDKCVAAPNSAFDEVWFFYPSASGGTGEIDSYVKYNIEEKTWDYGRLSRTAWIDQSILGNPIGATPGGVIYQHEVSPDADGQPLTPSFTTGWFVVAEGQELSFIDWFFPDMKWKYFNGTGSAAVSVLIEVANYPNQSPKAYGPYSISDAKNFVNLRLRGRLVRLTYSSNDIGTWWRLGKQRYRQAVDGRR